ncbi:sensor histidine kinase [Cystobacter ferrugineus]|uniref:histidine kinase n=1 Tax=Cystobacter ferrugineus TaxID=83449 RepID=A0A1L9B457_9BACT|nr:ATP-binding protein [Cystobacter ferrugineus]OJH37049.1 two-component sensor histidine kinase [Cystobacter ferrugineus]
MRLYQQLVLFMLAATVLPLVAVGFSLLSEAESELTRRIVSEQGLIAETTAEALSGELMKTAEALGRSAGLIDWEHVTPAEFEGGLRLLYGQSYAVSAVLVVDAEGKPQGAPLFQAEGKNDHPDFEPTAALALAQAVPVRSLRLASRGQVFLGGVYAHRPSGQAAMAMAVKLADGENSSFALAEVVFSELESLLSRRARPELGRIELVEVPARRILLSSQPGRRMQTLEPALASPLEAGGTAGRSFRVEPLALRVSTARVPQVPDFAVVVSLDEASALTPVRAMRRTVLLFILGAFAVLLGVGALFTRRLNRRLARVVSGAEAFSRGELHQRVQVDGDDELSDLASTFNAMGGELERARERLLRWNDDLKVRVDEATAELKTAQSQLLEAQKLAAVGQLGAGVAHEINNPLAGILGNTQLMMLERGEKDPDFETLRKIEQSAKRCKDITQNLLRFSQQRARPEFRPVDLGVVLRDALSLTENQVQAEGIQLSLELASPPVRVRADPGHLSQVVLALVSNARTAMMKSEQRRLTLRTGERDGQGFFEVEDTGKGIAPEHRSRVFEPFFTTKDVWSNVGLGLSVAWRVVSEAGGTIELRTEVGQGTCFTVWLPKA